MVWWGWGAMATQREVNPLVYLDITIGGALAGRITIEVRRQPLNGRATYCRRTHRPLPTRAPTQLRRDVVPKAAENFRSLCTGAFPPRPPPESPLAPFDASCRLLLSLLRCTLLLTISALVRRRRIGQKSRWEVAPLQGLPFPPVHAGPRLPVR